MIALGIDPGASNGAAVVVDTSARRVLAVVAWSTPARATKANPGRRMVVTTWRKGLLGEPYTERADDVPGGPLALLPVLLAALARSYVMPGVQAAAVEAIIVHRATSRRDALALAESAGACAYVAGTLAPVVLRPEASEWRRVVGVPLKPAALCATVARALVGDTTARVRMPARLGGLPAALAKIDHVADAALIAEWASITSRAAAGPAGILRDAHGKR